MAVAADRYELRIDAPGLNETVRTVRELEGALGRLRNLRFAQTTEFNRLQREITNTRREMDRLEQVLNGGGGTDAQRSRYEERARHLEDLKRQAADARNNIRDLGSAITENSRNLREWEDEIRGSVSALENLATALSMAGKASEWTKSFADSIGDNFSKMSKIFGINAFDTVKSRLTEMATESFVGDMGKIVSRYDIMSTFTKYMNLAGVESDEAADALQRVNDAILGLPIGLDEAAQRLRRYQMFLGDINKATNLTIGLQNAVNAGGANAQMKNYAFFQIDRLLSVGRLNTSRQWNSLIQGLGVSMRYVAEEMGLGYENVNQFAQGLADGSISSNDFLDALMRLGEGTSEAAKRLNAALEIYKGTIESWLSNLSYAAVRGGENVLKALELTLSQSTGKGITGYLKDFRDAINNVYSGIGTWIKNNPESLTKGLDAFNRLFDAVSRFSASNVAVAVFDNLARGVDMISNALNKLPKEEVEQFFAFATTLAGPLATVFAKVSEGAGVMLGVFQRFKDFDFEGLLDKIMRNVEMMAVVVEKLLSVLSDDALGDLIAFGLVWGKPVANVFATISKAVATLASHLGYLAVQSAAVRDVLVSIGGDFVAALPAVGLFGAALAAVLLRVGEVAEKTRELKKDISDDLSSLGIGSDISGAQNTFDTYDATKESNKVELSSEIGKAEELKRLYGELASVKERVNAGKITVDEGLEEQAVILMKLESIYPGLDHAFDENTGFIEGNSEALRKNGDAVAENMRKRAEAAAAQKNFDAAVAAEQKARYDLDSAEKKQQKLRKERRDLQDQIAKLTKAQEEYETYEPEYEKKAEEIAKLRTRFNEYDSQIKNNASDISFYNEKLKEAQEEQKAFAKAVEETGDELDEAGNSAQDYANKTEEALADMRKAYDELHESSQKTIDKLFPRTGTYEKQKTIGVGTPDQVGTINAEVKSQLDAAEQLDKNMDEIDRFLLANQGYQGGLGDYYQQLLTEGDVQRIQGLAEKIRQANDGSEQALKDLDTLDTNLRELEKKKFELVNEIDFASLMDDLGVRGTLEYLRDNGIPLENVPQEYIEQLAQKLAEEKSRVRKEALKLSKKDEFYATEEGEKEAGWLPPEGQLVSESEKKRAVEELKRVQQEIQEEAAASLAEDEDKSLVGGLNASKDLINELIDTNFPSLEEAIGGIAENETVLTTAVENVRSTTHTAIFDVIRALEDLMLKITGVRLRAQTEFPLVVTEINGVKKAVEELISKLEELVGRSWVFNVLGLFPAIPGGGGGQGPFSTGGFVDKTGKAKYFASGGLLGLFQPRGTDTIPAMLTPGEYVVRRGAVDQLGVPFLQRLNRMDIAGALDNLMHRFYRPSSAAYSVVNNSADNRAYNVNVYNYQSSEDYTYRVAAHFAHAL